MRHKPDDAPQATRFKLVIKTEDLSSWMAINNAFTKSAGTGDALNTWYWNGVLVQLGQYSNHISGDSMDGFGEIEIKTTGGKSTKIDKSMFADPHVTWINVVARTTRTDDPMTKDNLSDLGLESAVKSLHKYLEPYAGGITLWTERGYDLRTYEHNARKINREFTFELGKDNRVEVDVYHDGSAYKDSTGLPLHGRRDIEEITVGYVGGLPGGVHKNPPQRP